VQNYKTIIQYDGTNYHGWQMQANARTVQGELTRVLSMLDQRPVTIHGAGRTDAGVHAQGQVANFLLAREFEPTRLRDAVNGNLDRDLRVMEVEQVEPSFNARFAATRKTYRYQISTGAVVSPFVYRYAHHHNGPLDIVAMQRASSLLVGKHDFSAFTVKDSEITDRVRTLQRLDVEQERELITITAVANGFLRYMVRTIVGTLIEVGRGRRAAAGLSGVLMSCNRAQAGVTAPARGLTLMRVDY
jgi:tRNA pseudouridine38-40 synthase